MKNFICLFFILCSFSLFAQIQQAPLFPIKAEQNIPAIDKTSTDGVVKNAKDQKREIPIQKVIKVTSVKKGLAIETTGVADVAKAEIAEGKIFANLKWIVSLVKDDATFNNYVETYRSSSTDTIKRQAAKDMLKTIYNLVFAKNSYNNTLMTLASALESHGGKFLYDCKASSFENIESLSLNLTSQVYLSSCWTAKVIMILKAKHTTPTTLSLNGNSRVLTYIGTQQQAVRILRQKK